MLTHHDQPVAWAMLLYELQDAHEHLGNLVQKMATHGTIDEAGYRVELGHVFAHLNRAWHGRSDVHLADCSQAIHEARGKFPQDLEPIG